MSERTRSLLALFLSVSVPLALGGLGTISTARAIPRWYQRIRKPFWTPPSWLFGPVWTLLYAMMGTASWLVWKAGWERPQVRAAEGLFAGQLLVNALWTPIFFGRRAFGLALADIVLLWNLILATAIQFYRIRPVAGLLLVPYLMWVSYASTLNAGIWWLNRGTSSPSSPGDSVPSGPAADHPDVAGREPQQKEGYAGQH